MLKHEDTKTQRRLVVLPKRQSKNPPEAEKYLAPDVLVRGLMVKIFPSPRGAAPVPRPLRGRVLSLFASPGRGRPGLNTFPPPAESFALRSVFLTASLVGVGYKLVALRALRRRGGAKNRPVKNAEESAYSTYRPPYWAPMFSPRHPTPPSHFRCKFPC